MLNAEMGIITRAGDADRVAGLFFDIDLHSAFSIQHSSLTECRSLHVCRNTGKSSRRFAFHVGLIGTTSDRGIFIGDGQHVKPIALSRTIAPGTTGTFASFRDITLGNDGRVAFIGTLTLGVGGVDLTNNAGIWIGSSYLLARARP